MAGERNRAATLNHSICHRCTGVRRHPRDVTVAGWCSLRDAFVRIVCERLFDAATLQWSNCKVWSPPEQWDGASGDWRGPMKTCPRCGVQADSREIPYRINTVPTDHHREAGSGQ
jgi:hypothetical protein